jgi:hypothetical protein
VTALEAIVSWERGYVANKGVVKMESICQLVSDSLARHGMEPSLDHLRLQWSRWIRCESSFSVLLVPAKPGIFALGEEIIPAALDLERRAANALPEAEASSAERRASSPVEGKRMLSLFQISEAEDLGMSLGRLFLPGNPLLAKLNAGHCFARYAVVEDAVQRHAAYAIFQGWMRDSAETASGIQQQPWGTDTRVRADASKDVNPDSEVVEAVLPSISSAWGAGFREVQIREATKVICRPQPFPSGF